jgi:hypothetical protein
MASPLTRTAKINAHKDDAAWFKILMNKKDSLKRPVLKREKAFLFHHQRHQIEDQAYQHPVMEKSPRNAQMHPKRTP